VHTCKEGDGVSHRGVCKHDFFFCFRVPAAKSASAVPRHRAVQARQTAITGSGWLVRGLWQATTRARACRVDREFSVPLTPKSRQAFRAGEPCDSRIPQRSELEGLASQHVLAIAGARQKTSLPLTQQQWPRGLAPPTSCSRDFDVTCESTVFLVVRKFLIINGS
jgi:hypothetical protein